MHVFWCKQKSHSKQMFRATHNGYCNKERVRTPVLVQKRQITPPSLFSHPVYTNPLTQYIPDERRGMEELAFSVRKQVYEPVLNCNIYCELRGTWTLWRHKNHRKNGKIVCTTDLLRRDRILQEDPISAYRGSQELNLTVSSHCKCRAVRSSESVDSYLPATWTRVEEG